jgi:hypothetical protein
MVKELINFRIELEKAKALDKLALEKKVTKTDLLKEMVETYLLNDYSYERKAIVMEMIKDLKKPIAYLKTEQNKKKAELERKLREEIAVEVERLFRLI